MLLRRRLLPCAPWCRPCFAVSQTSDSATSPVIRPVEQEKRPNHRRYSAFNRGGRSQRVKELIATLKQQDAQTAKRAFEQLPPRERLDIMRALHNKRKKRRQDRTTSGLPRYRSATFERYYYFKEDDVEEESTLGRGPGGQATNRRMQTVILKHKPTGLIVKFSRFPSLWLNRRAARELMSVRLEERLLGPDSQLGRQRAAREKRKVRRGRVVKYLTKKGKKIEERQLKLRDVHGFLQNKAPLPLNVTDELGAAFAGRTLFLKSFFDEECQNLWPILAHAFAVANGVDATASGPPPARHPVAYKPPLIFYFMFPAFPKGGTPTAAERQQLALCASDPLVLNAVRQGFQCFAELFGLRVVRKSGSESLCAVRVSRDGMNFLQLRYRLFTADGTTLTPFASAAVPHVHRSLSTLNLVPEAHALVTFLSREVRRGVEGSGSSALWAKEGLELLTMAPKENITTDPRSEA